MSPQALFFYQLMGLNLAKIHVNSYGQMISKQAQLL